LAGETSIQILAGGESPEYVRMSLAAAITLGLAPGGFYRNAKLYCINLLLTYSDGCVGRCAYCGLSRTRSAGKSWGEYSFIRVDWPTIPLQDIVQRMGSESCGHVERVCVSMVTNGRARDDTLEVVSGLREKTDAISALITPTIIDKGWLYKLKQAGADKVGVAIDAAKQELFNRLRGWSVGDPHKWERYWGVVEEAIEVFGSFNVSIHLIVGLGEAEEEATRAIQKAYDMGALTHLFSFFPEEGSQMQDHPQPPIGRYRRVQIARYLINKGLASVGDMVFDGKGRLIDFGITKELFEEAVNSGLPFMTSGCASRNRENACNRPFSDSTPYQAHMGELRNFPFTPNRRDVKIIRKQIWDYSEDPVKPWAEDLGAGSFNQKYKA